MLPMKLKVVHPDGEAVAVSVLQLMLMFLRPKRGPAQAAHNSFGGNNPRARTLQTLNPKP